MEATSVVAENVTAAKLYQTGQYEEALRSYTITLDQLAASGQTGRNGNNPTTSTRIATLLNRSLCHTKLVSNPCWIEVTRPKLLACLKRRSVQVRCGDIR